MIFDKHRGAFVAFFVWLGFLNLGQNAYTETLQVFPFIVAK